jgi:hypothetical protein
MEMREVQIKQPYYPTDGVLFHIARLWDAIPDGPPGVWIENDLVSKSPVLRQCKKDGVLYRVIAFDPLAGIPENAPLRTMLALTSQSLPGGGPFGNAVPIDLYAEVVENTEQLTIWIEQAFANNHDPGELVSFAERVLTDSYAFACETVNILRQSFDQYWLRTPCGPSWWNTIFYNRKSDGKWFALDMPEDFGPRLLGKRWLADVAGHHPYVLLKVIGEEERQALHTAGPADKPTFADEMLATALVELHQNRIRSAVLHAFIGFESATKIGLDVLLSARFAGLSWVTLVDTMSREVSTVTLGLLVLRHAEAEDAAPPSDSKKITALYDTRNGIVHRNQRQMPPFERVRDQILEVRHFVKRLQSALKEQDATPPR